MMLSIQKAIDKAKIEEAGEKVMRANRHKEINRMKDKLVNPKKYERSMIAHLMNHNTGRYDIKSSPQERALKKTESPRAAEIRENNAASAHGNRNLKRKTVKESPFGAGPNKSSHPKGYYDKN